MNSDDYMAELKRIHSEMRDRQREILRDIFETMPPDNRAFLANQIGVEPTVEDLVNAHGGKAGEFALLESEGNETKIVWAPYEGNPRFGMFRFLDNPGEPGQLDMTRYDKVMPRFEYDHEAMTEELEAAYLRDAHREIVEQTPEDIEALDRELADTFEKYGEQE